MTMSASGPLSESKEATIPFIPERFKEHIFDTMTSIKNHVESLIKYASDTRDSHTITHLKRQITHCLHLSNIYHSQIISLQQLYARRKSEGFIDESVELTFQLFNNDLNTQMQLIKDHLLQKKYHLILLFLISTLKSQELHSKTWWSYQCNKETFKTCIRFRDSHDVEIEKTLPELMVNFYYTIVNKINSCSNYKELFEQAMISVDHLLNEKKTYRHLREYNAGLFSQTLSEGSHVFYLGLKSLKTIELDKLLKLGAHRQCHDKIRKSICSLGMEYYKKYYAREEQAEPPAPIMRSL